MALSPELRELIAIDIMGGMPVREAASKHGVSKAAVEHIKKGLPTKFNRPGRRKKQDKKAGQNSPEKSRTNPQDKTRTKPGQADSKTPKNDAQNQGEKPGQNERFRGTEQEHSGTKKTGASEQNKTSENSEAKTSTPIATMPGNNGGLLRRGGPGRPKGMSPRAAALMLMDETNPATGNTWSKDWMRSMIIRSMAGDKEYSAMVCALVHAESPQPKAAEIGGNGHDPLYDDMSDADLDAHLVQLLAARAGGAIDAEFEEVEVE